MGAAAALACLAETIRLDVPTNAAVRGTQLFEGAKKLKSKHELVGDVRGGHGLMTAMELVSDRKTKTPVDKALPVKLQEAVYDNGVMVRVSGPNLILSPPLILSEDEAAQIIDALDAGFSSL